MTPQWQRARIVKRDEPACGRTLWLRIGPPRNICCFGKPGTHDSPVWAPRFMSHLVDKDGAELSIEPTAVELLSGPDDFAEQVQPELFTQWLA